jgi:hypothetical protein
LPSRFASALIVAPPIGAGDVCRMIEQLARDVRKSIPTEALEADVKPTRDSLSS